MTDFHMAASDSAAGSLRVATLEFGLPGKIFCIRVAIAEFVGRSGCGKEAEAVWAESPGWGESADFWRLGRRTKGVRDWDSISSS